MFPAFAGRFFATSSTPGKSSKSLSESESVSHSVVSKSLESMDCSPESPQSMGFSRQEYWSGLPFPSPGEDQTWQKPKTSVIKTCN